MNQMNDQNERCQWRARHGKKRSIGEGALIAMRKYVELLFVESFWGAEAKT